eukprot:1153724-Pelagomonas_calceolata.AAC.4
MPHLRPIPSLLSLGTPPSPSSPCATRGCVNQSTSSGPPTTTTSRLTVSAVIGVPTVPHTSIISCASHPSGACGTLSSSPPSPLFSSSSPSSPSLAPSAPARKNTEPPSEHVEMALEMPARVDGAVE